MLKLKELREEKEFSQVKVAEAIKTSQRNISRWEKGENEPTSSFIVKLADFFEVSTDFLLGREDDFGIVQSQNAASALDKDEQELIENFRELNRLQKQKILAYTEGMLAAERQYTKK